jgi:quercetin dioxygenase-like cupin family protein
MNQVTTDRTSSFRKIAPGVELSLLRLHEEGGMTFLIRMVKGARAPLHDHPGGEETYMLSGRLRIENRTSLGGTGEADVTLEQGQYAFVPPGETHDGLALEDCVFLVVARGGVSRTA